MVLLTLKDKKKADKHDAFADGAGVGLTKQESHYVIYIQKKVM